MREKEILEKYLTNLEGTSCPGKYTLLRLILNELCNQRKFTRTFCTKREIPFSHIKEQPREREGELE